MRALVLAGGFGTRLTSAVPDLPKPLAPIAGKPFIEYLLSALARSGIIDVVLLTGYRASCISDTFGDGAALGLSLRYQVEDEPLGTGGAVASALRAYSSDPDPFLLLNGDTYFDISHKALADFHHRKHPSISMALKLMDQTDDRYGFIRLDGSLVTSFIEKKRGAAEGYINGGSYIIDQSILDYCPDRKSFSFEEEVLPKALGAGKLHGLPFGGHFIDIGVPEDYLKAQRLLPRWTSEAKRKAAFLDRDGTLVRDSGYVHDSDDLEIIPGALPLLRGLSGAGYELFIVSNQAGIAKGIFPAEEAEAFNAALISALARQGITIKEAVICPFHEEGVIGTYTRASLRRKPHPGMMLDLADQHSIDLSRSVMIGDQSSDRIELDYLRSYVLGEDGNYLQILEAILDEN